MKILYFDIASIMILLSLLATLYFRKMLSGMVNKILALLLVETLFTTIFDLWSEAYHVWIIPEESSTAFRYVLNYLYFFLRNLTVPLYQLFLFAITDTWHIFFKSKWLKVMLIAPYLLDCVILLSNLFHHQTFYFDQNYVYTRGPLLYVLYAVSFFYFLFGITYLIKYKRQLTTDKFVALLMMLTIRL